MVYINSMTESNEAKHSLEALASLVDLPVRTVRYYIQIGLIDRPLGEKKGAFYTSKHVDQLLTIRKWQLAGLTLERIKEILTEKGADLLPQLKPRGAGTVEVWSHMVVTDGLEITLEPNRAGMSSDDVREFFREVTKLFEQISERKK